MENNNSLIGKKIKFIYDDGHDNPVPKKGVVENVDNDFFYITNDNGNLEGLLKSRIIRFEVMSSED